jgi:hypothetical protein
MKKILSVLFLFISLIASATNYYIKNGGNDADTGLDDAHAWATLAKVTSKVFAAGDTIFFNRGDTFVGTLVHRESGTADNPIVFSAYGTGAKPVISGQGVYTGWVDMGGNIYYITNTYNCRYICMFNGTEWGDEVTSLAELDTQNEFYNVVSTGGTDNDTIYIYTTDPSDTANIVIGRYTSVVDIDDTDYLKFEKIAVKYGSAYCFNFYDAPNFVTVDSCLVEYAGTCITASGITNATFSNNIIRNGASDGFYLTGGSNGVTINDNLFTGNGEHSITGDMQAMGMWFVKNVNFHHNTLIHDGLGSVVEISSASTGGDLYQENINVYNNHILTSIEGQTIFSIGRGDFEFYNNVAILTSGHVQSKFIACVDAGTPSIVSIYHNTITGAGRPIQFYTPFGTESGTSSWIIKNNIIYGTTGYHYYFTSNLLDNIVCDYNIFSDDNGNKFYASAATNFAGWKVLSGDDTNSFVDDPEFILDDSADSLALAATSPAINAGTNVNVLLDYLDNARDANPDIGAYEYDAEAPVAGIPTVQTVNLIGITTKAATGLGNIVSENYASVTERGICWSTSANPTTADTKNSSGTGLGYYSVALTGLITNTTYHVRAYAINSEGTGYGDDIEFMTDEMNYLYYNGKIVTHNGKPVIVR